MSKIFAFMALLFFPVTFALADQCSLLASQFSQDKDSLKVDELAVLKKCITDQMSIQFTRVTPFPGTVKDPNTVPSLKESDQGITGKFNSKKAINQIGEIQSVPSR
ncbi:MAG: hypothetical protein AB7T38_11255 [Nitrospirales bacterium]